MLRSVELVGVELSLCFDERLEELLLEASVIVIHVREVELAKLLLFLACPLDVLAAASLECVIRIDSLPEEVLEHAGHGWNSRMLPQLRSRSKLGLNLFHHTIHELLTAAMLHLVVHPVKYLLGALAGCLLFEVDLQWLHEAQ